MTDTLFSKFVYYVSVSDGSQTSASGLQISDFAAESELESWVLTFVETRCDYTFMTMFYKAFSGSDPEVQRVCYCGF